ncbi:Polyadenylate-binding protein 7, partial [Cucurbita argyrosperma subsp. argyrosperma]
MRAFSSLILALAAVVLPAAVVYCGFPVPLLSLQRAFPSSRPVQLETLRARDRLRHARMLQGVVDFSVEGSSDPLLIGLYFTKVKLGTPPREFSVQIDTGSDILWVNCNSCNGCPTSSGLGVRVFLFTSSLASVKLPYGLHARVLILVYPVQIQLNFFDASISSSSSLISCSDPICNSAFQTTATQCLSQSKQCSYTFQYGDGSGTSGYYVSESMYFDMVMGPSMIVNSSATVVFGEDAGPSKRVDYEIPRQLERGTKHSFCSTYQSGDLTKSDHAIDGIFGFGPGDLSVISQLSARGVTPKVFSHCLKGEGNGGGILVLGEVLEPGIVYSPLVPSQPHYNLYLQSIAVNGQTLSIDPSVFATSNNRGTIVDSGTTLAYLVEEAYTPFVNAITAAVSQSVTPTISKGNQCYLVSTSVGEIFPLVSLNFAGSASMVLKPEQYLMHLGFYDGAALWCIGFQKVQEGVTILGDIVMKDKIFVYDLARQRIGWANYDCSQAVNVSVTSEKNRFVNAGQLSVSGSTRDKLLQSSTMGALAVLVSLTRDSCNCHRHYSKEGSDYQTSGVRDFPVVMAAVPQTAVHASPASLYVGDLHPDVTDGQLFDAFSGFKSLASVRICRDSATGRSLSYGYVNFMSPQDATNAIEAMNHRMLNGRAIRVMWSRRDPGARKSGIGNVFVKNLSDSINGLGLQELFKKFGNVLSSKVVTSDDGKSKGYGFVQFESEDSAKAAIESLNGFTIGDKQIYVGKFIWKSERVLANPDVKYTNLYVKNLDAEIGEEHLQEKFSEFGKISSMIISRDENGMSRGFGFINFVNSDDAKRALEALNGSQLGSKHIYIARAQKKTEREEVLRRRYEEKCKEQGSNVYVKNIEDGVTDEELRELFSPCGTITSSKLMRDDKGINKGFGFVCFSNPDEAKRAVNSLQGYMFHGKPLYLAIAQRKVDRQMQLRNQFAQRMAAMLGQSTLFQGGCTPYYYPAPGVVPQVPSRSGLTFQPLGMNPAWRANAFTSPARPAFQPTPVPIIPNASRQPRQNRGKINGPMLSHQNGVQSVYYMHNSQDAHQPGVIDKSSGNQQIFNFLVQRNVIGGVLDLSTNLEKVGWTGQVKYVPNARPCERNQTSGVSAAAFNSAGDVSQGSQILSSILSSSPPDQQKQILGEHLYPLVQKCKPELAAKITGMLLEMDNSELLLLLESPESLVAKVEEAVQVLKISKSKLSNQDSDFHTG